MERTLYNDMLRQEFELRKDIYSLTRFVLSETLTPICDYANAVELIRANFHRCTSGQLLIIGAFLISTWLPQVNDFLQVLNVMHASFPEREQAIIHYLNAYHMFMHEDNYRHNPDYYSELVKSTSFKTKFVYNHYRLAEITSGQAARNNVEEALQNVIKVYTYEELRGMTTDSLADPQEFINEHILGTHISQPNYELLQQRFVSTNLVTAPGS